MIVRTPMNNKSTTKIKINCQRWNQNMKGKKNETREEEKDVHIRKNSLIYYLVSV